MRYAGLSGQILVSVGLGVFAGYYADKWLRLSFPVFIWVLPLLVLCLIFYKLIKETAKKK